MAVTPVREKSATRRSTQLCRLWSWLTGARLGNAPGMSIFGFLFKGKKKRGPALKPRVATRLPMSEPVHLMLPCGTEHPAILQDVSSGGASLRTHQRMRVGEQLALWMHFGLGQHYELQARVVYARPGQQGFHARYGVRFYAISDEERFKLDTFVNDRVAAGHFGVRSFAPPHQYQ
jgi:hypothetical protein